MTLDIPPPADSAGGVVTANLDNDGLMDYLVTVPGHMAAYRNDGSRLWVKKADVCPDTAGMEVVLLEEELRSGKRVGSVCLAGSRTIIWQSYHEGHEPQKAAVGEFSPDGAGLEIWCRSRHDTGRTPFVFDARGDLIASWEMKSVAPEDWTDKNVEVIWTTDWTGEDKQLCAAKERHESGDVAIFDAVTGTLLRRFKGRADCLHVADVSGDWREEPIVLSGNRLHVHHNDAPNPNPDRPRLWSRNECRRSKMTWNYYSP